MKTTLTYTGIRVRDLEKSVAFYSGLLGMKEVGRGEIRATGGKVVSLASQDGGHQIELNHYPEGSAHAPKYSVGEALDHLAFQVQDLDAALAEAGRAGHPVVLDMKGPTSRWAYIQDPDGIWIELFA
jgi:lactoylglutathione lyase